MRTGIIHSYTRREGVYRNLKRQVVIEFQAEMEGTTGWRRDWLRWKRAFTLDMRYNELLFSQGIKLRSSLHKISQASTVKTVQTAHISCVDLE